MQFYIKDNFYFDIDTHNQLRISGPENHLFFGVTFPEDVTVIVKEYGLEKGQLWVEVELNTTSMILPIPVVTDIRTLRNHTEQVHPRPTYAELLQKEIHELIPKTTKLAKRNGQAYYQFSNSFTDETGKRKMYGTLLKAYGDTTLLVKGNIVELHGTEPLKLRIETLTNIKIKDRLRKKIFNSTYLLPRELFTESQLKIYDQALEQIEHLIRAKKTSSFEYGTIFPRDWIESADLGQGDLTQDTVDYMYGQSMEHISETGEAWHENLVGESLSKIKDPSLLIDRKMIDIEPRYLLGIRHVSKAFLTRQNVQDRLKKVATYVLKNAEEKELISFKQISDTEEYHLVGNWRDSLRAYPAQKSPLSPYDVNCVFYPMALRVIREFHQFFGVTDLTKLNETVEKWGKQKAKFRLYHSPSLIGYTLALHGKKHLPLPIAHLDESYDMFYGMPSLEEIVSFAEKVMDPNFFYTPVGPMLVDVDDENFTTGDYHGKVIWPKQAAYCVAGLNKQFRRGIREGWPWPVIEKIKAAVIMTAEACFKGWEDLGGIVPELYYYDEKQRRARFYTDQEQYEGQMSLIQLWSSVGCRRIMQDYASVKKIAEAI